MLPYCARRTQRAGTEGEVVACGDGACGLFGRTDEPVEDDGPQAELFEQPHRLLECLHAVQYDGFSGRLGQSQLPFENPQLRLAVGTQVVETDLADDLCRADMLPHGRKIAFGSLPRMYPDARGFDAVSGRTVGVDIDERCFHRCKGRNFRAVFRFFRDGRKIFEKILNK